ncbi:hypothetical protein B0A48_18761 [Cryoendolithus antarcticus]|uniref:Uncharacterized protein n=1 Tax=Cryoendolithus antarcticus TaxID=1507870 RepID=A0A1V8S7Q1_9PEZI|nr:hypothetical protein B0A48_18761 [Cryoendolithus antarcticus]
MLDIQAPQTLFIVAITAMHESTDSHPKACSTTDTALLTPISDDFHTSQTDKETLDPGSADTISPNMLFFPFWVHADPHDADDEHDSEVPTISTCAFTNSPPTLQEEQAAVYDAVDLGTSALLHPRGSALEHTLSRADMHVYELLCPPPRSTPALYYSFADAGEASHPESGCIDATGNILIGCSRTLLEAGRTPTPGLAIHDVEPLAALGHEQPGINTCLRKTEPWADLDHDFPAAQSLRDQWSPTISNDSPCDSLNSNVDDRTDSDKADTRSPRAGDEARSSSSGDQPAYELASVGSVNAFVRPRVPGACMMALRVSHLLYVYYDVACDALDGLLSRSYDLQTVQDVREM